ncbi:hypothetical protein PoB_004342400 [Plakobranchus ocellatus]|uniref:Uncharacterized protein n=1 Tax=Plakobranchus ocellatus TaxID=259542 RepID=A0AAV4BEY1_9GAST|nr:hypothetical protein PoB_004342400 [Plakobranchus ocellatus]
MHTNKFQAFRRPFVKPGGWWRGFSLRQRGPADLIRVASRFTVLPTPRQSNENIELDVCVAIASELAMTSAEIFLSQAEPEFEPTFDALGSNEAKKARPYIILLCQGAGGGARTRDRRISADLRADSPATVPPTPINIRMKDEERI